MREQLERLVKKCREHIENYGVAGPQYPMLRNCADELQAILDSQPVLPPQRELTPEERSSLNKFQRSQYKKGDIDCIPQPEPHKELKQLSQDIRGSSMVSPSKGLEWADRLDAIIAAQPHGPQPRFVPGMKIGPGHGRMYEETLVRFVECSNDKKAELWETAGRDCLWFDDDDLSRVIYDPRKSNKELTISQAREAALEISRQAEKERLEAAERDAGVKPQWKNGQRLVDCNGHVYKLHEAKGDRWEYHPWIWGKSAWGARCPSSHFGAGYVPWPRIGVDWVRFEGCSRVFQIAKNDIDCGYVYNTESGAWTAIKHLEPATPPEQTDPRGLMDSVKLAEDAAFHRHLVEANHPQTEFSGPHWEDKSNMVAVGIGPSILKDLSDAYLRDKDLASRIERIESSIRTKEK